MVRAKQIGKFLGMVAVVVVLYFAVAVRTPFGYRAVVWSVGGVSYEERQPGFSLVFRPIQQAYLVDVRQQRYVTVFPEGHEKAGEANAFVQSKDLQEISVKASLVYQVQPDQAAEIYDKVGPEYELAIIEPIFFDAIKEASGQRVALSFAEELASIAEDIEDIVAPQLAQRGISVASVALEDAVFDKEFILSVKEKVIADQEAAEQLKLVEAERAKKTQIELQAQAEQARAASLGLTPEQYLRWLYLQRWDGQLPVTLLGDASDVSLLIGVPE